MSDRTIPSAATILASENDFLRRENIRLREVINARFIKYSNMDSEREALAARLEIAEAERNDALRASMKDMARLAEATALLRNVRPYVCGLGYIEAINAFVAEATDSADVVPCRKCGGSGAVDAPTSADDPSCPDCDGEGNIAVCEHCGRADAFDGMWHKSDCPALNHPIQKPYPPMTGSGDGEGNAPKNSR